MEGRIHFLNCAWRQLRFLPASPLAQLLPPGDGEVLDGLLARAGIFRPGPPRRKMDRLPQLKGYLALPGTGPASRFSDGSFRALYAGESLATCVAEMAFHHGRALADSGEPAGAIRVFEGLEVRVAGDFLDVRKGHSGLHRPGDYGPSQAFGRDARSKGEPGLVYRSVRRRTGHCLTIFAAEGVRTCTLKDLVPLTWDGIRLTSGT
jgi:hypothetical protein